MNKENFCKVCDFQVGKGHLKDSVCVLCSDMRNPSNNNLDSAKFVCSCGRDMTNTIIDNFDHCESQIIFSLTNFVLKLLKEKEQMQTVCEQLEKENGDLEREMRERDMKEKELVELGELKKVETCEM